jgi:polyisoprenoid-binding protein YceI
MIALLLALALQAPTQTPVQAPPPPKLALERWQVDARFSTVGFDGESTVHDFTGKTHAITGELRFDPGSVATCAGGAVWIEARTLDTDNSSRDEDMQKALDVATFPQIVFTLDRVNGKLTDGRGDLVGHGHFNVKGVETKKEFHFKVEPAEGGTLHVVGDAKLKLSEHDVKPPRVLFLKVKDDLRVWFDLRLAKVPAKLVRAKVRTLGFDEVGLRMKPGAARGSAETYDNGNLWITDGGSVWERPAANKWLLDVLGRVEILDPGRAETRPAVIEPSDSTTPVPERTEPVPGTVAIRVAGLEWLRFEGLEGDYPIGRFALRLALDRVDGDWAGPLLAVRGVPRSLMLYALEPRTNDRVGQPTKPVLTITFGPETEAMVPEWAVDVKSWLRAPEVAKPAAKKPAEKRSGDDDR